MIKEIDITDQQIAKEVLNVQIPAYQEEAKIIDDNEIPPLKDTVRSLCQSEETFYGYYVGNKLCGVISLKVNDGVADIHRLIVHPNFFRKGIAQQLLGFIERIAGIESLIVSTSSKNTPAVNFYVKNGFLKTGKSKVNESLSLSHFKKNS